VNTSETGPLVSLLPEHGPSVPLSNFTTQHGLRVKQFAQPWSRFCDKVAVSKSAQVGYAIG